MQPGSFLSLMIGSKHQGSGRGFSDDETISQAFTFLLAGCVFCTLYPMTASAMCSRSQAQLGWQRQ